jgi:hypothetical protein
MLASAATSVLELGLKGDGQTDDTAPLQQALASGILELDFPAGSYLLGTTELPAGTCLHFSPTTRVLVAPVKIRELQGETPKDSIRPLFSLKGDRIVVDGLDAAGILETVGKDQRGRERPAVNHLFYGENVADLTFRRLRVVLAEKKTKAASTPIYLRQCRDIVLADSQFENIQHGIETLRCQNVSVHGNRAFHCNTITTFTDSEYLRHYDNWSRCVTYQCVFRGGSPDPSRKAPRVPLGSSATVLRGQDPKAEGASSHLAGAYDIQISHNYAEYGRTLAWGNKGRDVLFEGNVCRFTTDYAYGVEGCENVTFANNIAINARSVGIMSMYWGDKLVITGNQVIVRDAPYFQEFSAFPEQKAYWGGLLRFHHGPTTAEDTAAGSRYGAGRVIVSGNLLVNELHDQVRSIRIEGGRDVLISGNKIVNGWVFKSGDARNKCSGGAVTVIGNEFTSDLPVPHGIIGLGSGTEQAIVKDNVMRFTGGGATVAAQRQVTPDGQGEAEAAHAEEKLQTALPAISNLSGAKTMTLLLVEGNVIQGWVGEAIDLSAVRRDSDPIRFIVRNNSVEGAIRLTGLPASYRGLVTNNINLKTLEPVQPVLVPQEPAGK